MTYLTIGFGIGILLCMIVPIVLLFEAFIKLNKRVDELKGKYNSMFAALSDRIVAISNSVDAYCSYIDETLAKKVDELDSKIGGEDWKEMVEAEKQYAISLANLASYQGEEQR